MNAYDRNCIFIVLSLFHTFEFKKFEFIDLQKNTRSDSD